MWLTDPGSGADARRTRLTPNAPSQLRGAVRVGPPQLSMTIGFPSTHVCDMQLTSDVLCRQPSIPSGTVIFTLIYVPGLNTARVIPWLRRPIALAGGRCRRAQGGVGVPGRDWARERSEVSCRAGSAGNLG
jgi:hypothetical protein